MRDVVRECKMRGLSLRVDAARAMEKFLGEYPEVALQSLVEVIRKRDVRVVDLALVEAATEELHAPPKQEDGTLQTLEAWDVKKLMYDMSSRKFALKKDSWKKHGSATSRIEAYRTRYEFVWQRVNDGKIQRLDAVRSSNGSRICVLAVLVQSDSGVELEDPRCRIQANVAEARALGGGYFAEGMVVLAEGILDAVTQIFHVDVLGHPPPMTRKEAFKAIGKHLDIFHASSSSEGTEDESPWIVVNEPHLDAAGTLPRLRQLIQGLIVPSVAQQRGRVVVIFVGNFMSVKALAPAAAVRDASSRFADLAGLFTAPEFDINGAPLAAFIDFILVPGPRDLSAGPRRLLPRDKLATAVIQPFLDKLDASVKARGHLDEDSPRPSVTLGTSPCRIKTPGGKELVVHRDNALRTLRRLSASLLPGTADEYDKGDGQSMSDASMAAHDDDAPAEQLTVA